MRRAVAVGGGVLCVVVAALVADSPYRDTIESLATLGPVIGAAFIATGAWAWDRLGRLMMAVGLAFLMATLLGARSSDLAIVGLIAFSLPYAVLLHLLLAFPDGRLRTGLDRFLVTGGYLVDGVWELPQALITQPGACGCGLVRHNPLLIADRPGLYDALETTQTLLSIAALIATGCVLARRYRIAAPRSRTALQPVLGAGVIIVASLVVTLVADVVDLSDTFEATVDLIGRVVVLLVPALFLVGLARTRLADLEADVRASSARLVAAQDAERRRLERDLHDGAQQRLVSLALTLRLARRRADGDLAALLDEAAAELGQATEELRELARGIHPAVLTDRGLRAAVNTLAARAPVPVCVDGVRADRLPAPVESAAYFVVAEALTNVARYARASEAAVAVERRDGHVIVTVADDGAGGADPEAGSGLRGLADRLAAEGGTLAVESPRGRGTVVTARLPCAS